MVNIKDVFTKKNNKKISKMFLLAPPKVPYDMKWPLDPQPPELLKPDFSS